MSHRIVYIGIDVHARNCVVGSMDARGRFEGSHQIATCEKKLIDAIERIDGKTKHLCFEEGTLSQWLCQVLHPYVTDITIANPLQMKLISSNARKRDDLDVYHLCRLHRLGELKNVYHAETDDRAIFKSTMKQYLSIRKHVVSLKTKIKDKYRWYANIRCESSTIYQKKDRGTFLKQIQSRDVREGIERYYRLLDEASQALAETLNHGRRLGRRYPEIKEFLKIPGVGHYSALIFDAYIQTPYRFQTKSQLYRYCRLSVVDRSSDGKPLTYKRLDPSGNKELKAVSHIIFRGAISCKGDNEVKRFYHRCLKKHPNETHARLTTQRKLLSVMHGIWRKKEEYRPELFAGV